MIEIYLWILLGLVILFGVGSIVFSIIIFFPKKKFVSSKARMEYYGSDYYKEKKFPNVTEILEKEIAKRNDKLC